MRKIIIIALMVFVAASVFADGTADTSSAAEVLTLNAGEVIKFTVEPGNVLSLTGPADSEGNAFSVVLTLPDGTEEVVTGTLSDGLCTLSYTFAVSGGCSIAPVGDGALTVYSYSLA